MKIVDTDNFGGDYPDEQVIAGSVKNKHYGELICELLNRHGGQHARRFYKLVEDDYELQPGFEP